MRVTVLGGLCAGDCVGEGLCWVTVWGGGRGLGGVTVLGGLC